jgi:hypothetical protein
MSRMSPGRMMSFDGDRADADPIGRRFAAHRGDPASSRQCTLAPWT